MPENFDHIINGCKKGDPKAQRELYYQMKDKLFGVCLRYAGNYDDAHDILQDGFVKVYEKINQFRFEGSFEGWVRRIMVNTALEKYRTQCQVIHINDNMKEDDNTSGNEVDNDLTAKELLGMIQELTPKYRLVFNMFAIEGYSHKEISELLNISEGTSKSNLSRARTILQTKVKKSYNPAVKVMK